MTFISILLKSFTINIYSFCHRRKKNQCHFQICRRWRSKKHFPPKLGTCGEASARPTFTMWAHPRRGCRPSDSSQGLGCGKSGESGQGVSAGRFTFGSGVGIPGCQACSSEMPIREPLQVIGLSFVCVYVAHKLLQVTGLSFLEFMCVCVYVAHKLLWVTGLSF